MSSWIGRITPDSSFRPEPCLLHSSLLEDSQPLAEG